MSLNLPHNGWMFLVTVGLTTVVTLLLMPLAQRIGLVDHPGRRKVHEFATPLVGGTALFIILAVVLSLTTSGDRFLQALGAGGLMMVITGMVDDSRGLSAALRFLVQICACYLVIQYADVRLHDFGPLFSDDVLALGWLSGPITIFAAMGVINAFNMIDGLDGLAGSIFLVAAIGMALFAATALQATLYWLLLVSIAAVLGFMLLNARLPWNPKARVFLGDAGSLLLGFMLAWCLIRLGSSGGFGERVFMPMTAVWLVAVPLLDTTTLMWRRWRSGESAFAADQYHLHHAFLRAGYGVGETWIAMTLLALVLAGVGVIFEVFAVVEYVSFYVFMGFAFAYYFYMRYSWEKQRFLGRDFIYNDFTVGEGL